MSPAITRPRTPSASSTRRCPRRCTPLRGLVSAPGRARHCAAEASRLLGAVDPSRRLVGLHASGGREIKQWHMERFAEVATRLARDLGAVIVLTGTRGGSALGRSHCRPAGSRTSDDSTPQGRSRLPVFAALMERLRLFITCDTGPMHLAAAVGTQVVALFGPSDPARYGPALRPRGSSLPRTSGAGHATACADRPIAVVAACRIA